MPKTGIRTSCCQGHRPLCSRPKPWHSKSAWGSLCVSWQVEDPTQVDLCIMLLGSRCCPKPGSTYMLPQPEKHADIVYESSVQDARAALWPVKAGMANKGMHERQDVSLQCHECVLLHTAGAAYCRKVWVHAPTGRLLEWNIHSACPSADACCVQWTGPVATNSMISECSPFRWTWVVLQPGSTEVSLGSP